MEDIIIYQGIGKIYNGLIWQMNILWFGWEQPPYPISENYGEESHRTYQKDK